MPGILITVRDHMAVRRLGGTDSDEDSRDIRGGVVQILTDRRAPVSLTTSPGVVRTGRNSHSSARMVESRSATSRGCSRPPWTRPGRPAATPPGTRHRRAPHGHRATWASGPVRPGRSTAVGERGSDGAAPARPSPRRRRRCAACRGDRRAAPAPVRGTRRHGDLAIADRVAADDTVGNAVHREAPAEVRVQIRVVHEVRRGVEAQVVQMEVFGTEDQRAHVRVDAVHAVASPEIPAPQISARKVISSLRIGR